MKLEPQIIGNAGLYYCCYRLSLLGWNVMPTARNARGVDIIVYNRDASQFRGIQVKSLSKRNAVPLGTSLDKIMGDYWIIVNNLMTTPSVFILTRQEILDKAKKSIKADTASYWLEVRDYEQEPFREAWERLGLIG